MVFNTKGEIADISTCCEVNEQEHREIRNLMYDLNEFKDNYPQYSEWIEMGMPKPKNYYCKIKDKFGVEYKVVDTNKGFYVIEEPYTIFKKDKVELIETYDNFTHLD